MAIFAHYIDNKESRPVNQATSAPAKKENGLLNLGINVIIPSFIMMKLSKDQYLGQAYALVLALVFPLSYGLYDFIKRKKMNFFSGLGLASILLTGGIGLLNLDRKWMVAKETGIPLIMGLAILYSQFTKYPLVKNFLGQMLDLDKIDNAFKQAGHNELFEKRIQQSSFYLAGTFFISALLNYVLAERILVGQPGSVEFNESLGKMTALSFPVISVPMTLMVGGIIFYLFYIIKKKTNLEIEEILKQ